MLAYVFFFHPVFSLIKLSNHESVVATSNDNNAGLETGVEANALFQQAMFVEQNHFHLHSIQAVAESIVRD